MEECALAVQKGNLCDQALHSSVECIVELLKSLQVLSGGEFDATVLSNAAVETIRGRYEHLSDVDYSGPLTYQSMARLPIPYRDAVAVLRQNGGFETSSASDSDVEQVDAAEVGSNNSGDTEGPEEENQTSGDDELSQREEGHAGGGSSWPYSNADMAPKVKADGDVDRKHAKEFAKAITQELVPKLVKLRSSMEVDEAMQEFASGICQDNSLTYSDFDYNLTTLNADGIYLATYSALLLGLQLTRAGHYEEEEREEEREVVALATPPAVIPLTELQFVTSVQNAGVLVYLSSAWLCELYQCILAINPFGCASRDVLENHHCAVVDMLCDAGGLGPTQMLSDWQRLQSVARQQADRDERQIAGKKLARRLLTCCWESMVTVLSVGMGNMEETTKSRIVALSKKTLRVKRRQRLDGETLYALSLEGLHSAATLSNSLSLQHLSGKILTLISNNVCQTTGSRIPANQALSMDVLLSGGLELGSYSQDCWLPVFSVCRHVTQLEHDLFSLQNSHATNNTNTLSNVQANNNKDGGSEGGEKNNNNNNGNSTPSRKFNLTFDEDETCVDVYSFLQSPLQNPNTNVTTILKPYSGTNDPILLSHVDTAKILCALSHQADSLFNDAAERLSLPSLCQFLKSLCKSSRDQLYRNPGSKLGKKSWWPSSARAKELSDSYPLSLLLHRVGDVTLKVFRGPRPLLHILKVWAITGPHLMDVSGIKLKLGNRFFSISIFPPLPGCLPSRQDHFQARHRVHSRCNHCSAGGAV